MKLFENEINTNCELVTDTVLKMQEFREHFKTI